jgi:hypothetical protein
MEKVFPLDGKIIEPTKKGLPSGKSLSFPDKCGWIERIVDPGRYIVSLESGVKVTVRGPETLKVGEPVQVFENQMNPAYKAIDVNNKVSLLSDNGVLWSIMMPLAFGGKGALACLEAFVEKRTRNLKDKTKTATYFVFTHRTEKQGEIQWSIYLRGMQIALQVYSKDVDELAGGLKEMVRDVEESLRQCGYILMAPAVFLRKPFIPPPGFRINVRG